MPIPIADLMEEAKCFCSTGGSNAEKAIMALLQRIAESSAGSGSQFISGAGAPVAAPANPDAPAQYFDTTNDFTYNWNLGTQAWVPVPKVYRAILFQSGVNAPVATVLENTLSGTPVWSYLGVGIYPVVLAGAFPFATTAYNISPGFTGDTVVVSDEDGNTLQVRTKGHGGGIPTDDILYNTTFEVLVYP